MELISSTISNNLSVAVGGAHNNGYGGSAKVIGNANVYSSTISENTAQSAAAIVIVGQAGTVQRSNFFESTISDNRATRSTNDGGGAIYVLATSIYISNSTITGNTETNPTNTKYGAGLTLSSDTEATINSSIIAGNSIPNGENDLGDDIGSQGGIQGSHNVIELSQISVPSDTIVADPMLGPLTNNGGPTMTRLLQAGSPAIDTGSNPNFDGTDQRGPGYPRVVGSAPDLGAVEYSPVVDDVFHDGFETAGRGPVLFP